jgi:V/A-type H+/Na+-transporting ATPase subunit D
MARLKLSKSSLAQQRIQLKLYTKLLPSLDLKRRQLLLEHKKADAELVEAKQAVDRLEAEIGAELPMLAGTEIDLKGLVKLRGGRVSKENIAGVTVPKLEAAECETQPYSMLAWPAWVDRLVQRLKDATELRLRVRVQSERTQILGQSLRRITQRVNLFERILIPSVKQNIKRIQIFLGDLDREAVIRSKLSKGKHADPLSSEVEAVAQGATP